MPIRLGTVRMVQLALPCGASRSGRLDGMTQGPVRRWLRDWRFVAIEAVTSAVSILYFCIGLVLVALTIVPGGVLLLPGAVRVLHGWSDDARRRIGAYRRESIQGPAPVPQDLRSIDERIRLALSPATVRDALWLAVDAIPLFSIAIVTIVIPLGAVNALAVPFYWQYAPADEPVTAPYPVTSWPLAATMPLMALVYVLISWALIPAVARLLALISSRLLAAPLRSSLAERVDALTLSRAAALDAHAAELRRIERDLHDGAQNRLVAVVMMLGIAERSMQSEGGQTVEQLRRAQEAATEALSALRRTVHDIYPPILDELGLEGALASLAGRSAVPCTLEAGGVGRVPAAVESATYFIVAEALSNVNKHSAATAAAVRVRRREDVLEITVEDDGIGGAVERPGGGYAGIRKRLEAFEGAMTLISPAGGPTVLRTELPCGS